MRKLKPALLGKVSSLGDPPGIKYFTVLKFKKWISIEILINVKESVKNLENNQDFHFQKIGSFLLSLYQLRPWDCPNTSEVLTKIHFLSSYGGHKL